MDPNEISLHRLMGLDLALRERPGHGRVEDRDERRRGRRLRRFLVGVVAILQRRFAREVECE